MGQLNQMNAAGGQTAPLGADMQAQNPQAQADAVNMQVTALRHDAMLQQMQGMSPVAGAAIPPLLSAGVRALRPAPLPGARQAPGYARLRAPSRGQG